VSTVRTWLIAGELGGHKLNGQSWRVQRSALREHLAAQAQPSEPVADEDVDIGACAGSGHERPDPAIDRDSALRQALRSRRRQDAHRVVELGAPFKRVKNCVDTG
jgi:excisionase family DNA binding protein